MYEGDEGEKADDDKKVTELIERSEDATKPAGAWKGFTITTASVNQKVLQAASWEEEEAKMMMKQ